jgi:small subunit ribosomal protein S4
MTKRLESKYKINRRLNENLWGRAKSPLNRNKTTPPGQHGQRRKKLSDFGVQLQAKQKLKGYYGNITEKQFRNIYELAVRARGDTSEALIGLLERRLDAVVYRMKLAVTPFAARQLINHGHIKVDGRRVNISSFRVKDGQTVEVADRSRQMAVIIESTQAKDRDIPEYIHVEGTGMKGTFVRAPQFADVPYPVKMDPHLVIEFYSR